MAQTWDAAGSLRETSLSEPRGQFCLLISERQKRSVLNIPLYI